jgi:hypothetical protein
MSRGVVRLLSPVRVRLFLCSWIVFSLHFATNVVREHYPAFSLIQDGTLTVDRYRDFHPDIFVHPNGHAVVGNNVAASVIAAVPLFVFTPVLDRLEAYERDRVRRFGVPPTEYRNAAHPNSQKFYNTAKAAGLTLRFGASAAVTTIFLMAPLSALMILLMLHILVDRGVPQDRAVVLALLFGFGTPVFFRTGVLNHNMMLMCTTFVAYHLLWVRPGGAGPPSAARRLTAGFLAGLGFALDYSGLIPLVALFVYAIGSRLRQVGIRPAIVESLPFVAAAVPPVLFLLYSQWSMYGNPFYPGQYWMPDVSHSDVYGQFRNPYSSEGFRGLSFPSPSLLLLNLFSGSYGMYTYGPLLLVGLIPAYAYRRDTLIYPRSERVFAAAFFLVFVLFCAANQYSRIQFNSGFRYLIPLVPTIFLAASDHLARMPRRWLMAVGAAAVANSWVISMVREPVPDSWRRVLSEGIQFPWLTVLRLTSPADALVSRPWLPLAIAAASALLVVGIWKAGESTPSEAGSPNSARTGTVRAL